MSFSATVADVVVAVVVRDMSAKSFLKNNLVPTDKGLFFAE